MKLLIFTLFLFSCLSSWSAVFVAGKDDQSHKPFGVYMQKLSFDQGMEVVIQSGKKKTEKNVVVISQDDLTPKVLKKLKKSKNLHLLILPSTKKNKKRNKVQRPIDYDETRSERLKTYFTMGFVGLSAVNWFYFSGVDLPAATAAFMFQAVWNWIVVKKEYPSKFSNWFMHRTEFLKTDIGRRLGASLIVHLPRVFAFSSILAWDQFLAELSTWGFYQKVGVLTVISAFGAGIWQSVNAKWQDSKNPRSYPLSKTGMTWMMAITKGLTTSLAPFVMVASEALQDIQNGELKSARVIGLAGYVTTGLVGFLAYLKGAESISYLRRKGVLGWKQNVEVKVRGKNKKALRCSKALLEI